MTTFVPFQPVNNANFQFAPEFDGNTYSAVITWNAYGLRYYINLYDQYNNLIYIQPLIGSPDNYNINMNLNYFNTPLIFRSSSQNFEIG